MTTLKPNLTLAVAGSLKLHPDAVEITAPRNANILRHYQSEIDRQHMGLPTAIERCIGDLMGRNHRDGVVQCDTIKLSRREW